MAAVPQSMGNPVLLHQSSRGINPACPRWDFNRELPTTGLVALVALMPPGIFPAGAPGARYLRDLFAVLRRVFDRRPRRRGAEIPGIDEVAGLAAEDGQGEMPDRRVGHHRDDCLQ